jgi:phosphate uptake regulator
MKRFSNGANAPRRIFKKKSTFSGDEIKRVEEGLKAIQTKHLAKMLTLTDQVSTLLKEIKLVEKQMDKEARELNADYQLVARNFTLTFTGVCEEEQGDDDISLKNCCSFFKAMHLRAKSISEGKESVEDPSEEDLSEEDSSKEDLSEEDA